MDIYSLYNQVKFDTDQNMYNLFEPSLIYNDEVDMGTYTITRDDEMRIDLVFQNIYQIDDIRMKNEYTNIDILAYINNIYNVLNLKSGMVIQYPLAMDDFVKFRYVPETKSTNTDIIKQLGTENLQDKTTKTDLSRQNYIENNYSLPPVVLDTPREPVRIENGNFSIGGL